MAAYVEDTSRCFALVEGRQCKFSCPGKDPGGDPELCTKHQKIIKVVKCVLRPPQEPSPKAKTSRPSGLELEEQRPGLDLEETGSDVDSVQGEVSQSSDVRQAAAAEDTESPSLRSSQRKSTTVARRTDRDNSRPLEAPLIPAPSSQATFQDLTGNTRFEPIASMDYRRLRHSIPVISPKAAFHSRTASAQNIAPSSEGDAGLGPLISQISALKIGIQKLTDHVSIVDQRVARVESMLMAQDKTGGHHGTVKQFVKEFEARDSWVERPDILSRLGKEIEHLQEQHRVDQRFLREAVSTSFKASVSP